MERRGLTSSCLRVTGAFGLMWFIVWTFVGYEKPCKHPRISEEERMYIEKKINENTSVISNKVTTTIMGLHAVFVCLFVRVRAFVCVLVSVCQPVSLFIRLHPRSLSSLHPFLHLSVRPADGRLFTFTYSLFPSVYMFV